MTVFLTFFFHEAFLLEKKKSPIPTAWTFFSWLWLLWTNNITIFSINFEYFVAVFLFAFVVVHRNWEFKKWFLEQQNLLVNYAEIKKWQLPSFWLVNIYLLIKTWVRATLHSKWINDWKFISVCVTLPLLLLILQRMRLWIHTSWGYLNCINPQTCDSF